MKACSLGLSSSKVTLSVSPGKPVFEEGTFAQELAGGSALLILVSWEEDESLTLTSKKHQKACAAEVASPNTCGPKASFLVLPESSVSQAKLF